MPQDTAARLAAAHAALLAGGDPAAARAAAEAVLEATPDLHPAAVLAAQAELVARDFTAAARRVEPVVALLPTWSPAQLVRGRAAELLGDLPGAYAAYRALGAGHALAARRAHELRPRAIEIVERRLREAIERGHQEQAAGQLALLSAWAPGEEPALRGARLVAAAAGDRLAELAAVRLLAQRHPEERELLERRAELEIEAGDPGTGVQLLQDLVARHPDDPALADKLAAAKFEWRLRLLPATVREAARQPQLTRGEYALLLHWLVPEVRYGRPANPRIAADILDHPYRDEIVRVANLGLMDVDATLHRFAPDRPLNRAEALIALVRLLAAEGPGAVPCLGALAGAGRPPRETACAAAAACGLLPTSGDCLPGAPLGGPEALTMIRRSLELLGSR